MHPKLFSRRESEFTTAQSYPQITGGAKRDWEIKRYWIKFQSGTESIIRDQELETKPNPHAIPGGC